jgi:hypothetical protein
MCLGYPTNKNGHCNSVSLGPMSCVCQRATFGSFADVGKRWLQNWKLKKYKIINSFGKVSNFNFILKTNFY